jgi:hypothetical protein
VFCSAFYKSFGVVDGLTIPAVCGYVNILFNQNRIIFIMDRQANIRIGISLYPNNKQQLDELCEALGVHQSELIRLLIRQEYERRVKGPQQ